MKGFSYIMVNIIGTLLRFLPLAGRTGLIRLGSPDRNSPVLLTANYILTVARVKRALAGINAFLLVANSRGINVWCAATGGHLTAHEVISLLKTTGIEKMVDHKEIILPQLAATGIEASAVKKRSGWQVIWGPVYASDIPAFLKAGCQKTLTMQQVGFPWQQRLEMAIAWAFPLSVITGVIMAFFWPGAAAMLASLVWGLSLLIFMGFPLYSRRLRSKNRRVGFVFIDFGHGGLRLLLWFIVLAALAIYTGLTGDHGWWFFLRWALVSLILVLVLNLDLMGSTPVYKSGLHEDRWFEISLDGSKCRGAGFCEQVCPRACYEMAADRRKVALQGTDRCVQCGACIVQCPFDALFFSTPEGNIVPPEAIRKFKLNMMGKRIVKVSEENH